MDQEFLLKVVLVFVAVFALDFVWAFYTKALTDSAALRAAMWATLLIVLTGTAQIGYTHDWRLLVPAAFGAFAGTFLAIRFHLYRASRAKE